MALTRKMLKAMGIEEEKIDQIIEAHTETVEALKEERENYRKDAETLKDVQKELDGLKKDGGDWQTKYEKEHSDFEAYKSAQTAKETKATKEMAYRELLKEAGISEKRVETIMKVTNLDEIELDKDGKIVDSDKHKETVKTEFVDFVETKSERGAYVPGNQNRGSSYDGKDLGTLSMKEYIAARKQK